MRSTFFTLLVCALAGGLVAGCGKRPLQRPDVPGPAATAEPPPAPAPPVLDFQLAVPAAVESEDAHFARKTLAELNAERPLGDVFFEVDSERLRETELEILRVNARWLARWPSTRITVEGHCDARGTPEYNLALGERRAAGVKSYLVSLGVPADRVTTVTKGKEEPICGESGEACWQRNRRGHSIITGK
jgi:peptidoglycan-associated lipoprotein